MIDLGPADDQAHKQILEAAVDAGFEPILDGGLDQALAGQAIDRDGLMLAAAMQDAEHAFGRLDCKDAVKAAKLAIGLAAARQAAGLPVPELTHALAYVLLCADKNGDANQARIAASRLRALGGSTDIDATLMARYPEMDTTAGREMFELEIQPALADATVFIDFAPASGTHVVIEAGEHVIAAAKGTRRGYVAGPAVPSQKQVAIPMPDQAGENGALAARVAAWKGQLPSAAELAAVLKDVHARVALVRHGDTVEAWGRAGLADPVRRLGGDDGSRPIGEVDRLALLAADRVQAWNDHAPDPDQPLLVEDVHSRAAKKVAEGQEPTKWWVYATIGGALLAGAIVIYAHESASDTQRVELHYP
ncbi:MAG: hypothetical protein JO257_09055 [Deltaproteobacteria bacterium]|nr:hypothetical protein [Deltaproteobacteria bacterium]